MVPVAPVAGPVAGPQAVPVHPPVAGGGPPGPFMLGGGVFMIA